MFTYPSLSAERSFRLPSTLIFSGVILSLVAGYFHPEHAQPNHHAAIFVEYADSRFWTLIHLGNFVGMLLIVASLLVLYFMLSIPFGWTGLVSRLGAIVSVAALTLYGVLEAVDGVALKQAVDAWAAAPAAEKVMRFAGAETIRWLEWAFRSYQCYLFGLSLLLLGLIILQTAEIPRPIGFLMSVSGLAYFGQGWIIGTQGFSPLNAIPGTVVILSILIWSTSLFVLAWWKRVSQEFAAQKNPARPLS